ncbi:hypothetical protein I549_1197 [Mycobacterium avium subsp. avium 2285 (R)]|uniref:Uncharacterized protein n=1 Tax=Mycobacterium avium (strain 104) TaxID=243243 RepID=A0A0H3A284_MYCA1|nr:hypothetical protein MAV_4753 [Mycobacterium avium 104]ETZ48210.1 hypothetical protein L839_2319 [Mycobacterium avium MAV_120809_2495]ETZ49543.1 hypothetical protein L837_0299 [Mycobacterium avium MAV_061107_1842]ETZ55991.1 hypothetical protein L838_0812 [Mycobacterium avium MAV_120709_2344]EUA40114.1 hypothetical protein I549_1197 [Mycobacterium avium subsp. avium 2285 (R)]
MCTQGGDTPTIRALVQHRKPQRNTESRTATPKADTSH